MGTYECEKGSLFLKENWILELSKSVGFFVMVPISDIPTIKYWQTLEKTMVREKNIPK